MKHFAQATRRLATAARGTIPFLLASVWAAPAMAQNDAEASGPWVLPYALVIMGVALGLLMVLRPSKRRDRARPERYEDGLAEEE